MTNPSLLMHSLMMKNRYEIEGVAIVSSRLHNAEGTAHKKAKSTDIKSCAACRFSFEQRAELAQCPLGKQLFELMAQKRTNLAVAADVPTAREMLQLADLVTPLEELLGL